MYFYESVIYLISSHEFTFITQINSDIHQPSNRKQVHVVHLKQEVHLTLILLIMTIVVFNQFYQPIKSLLLGMNCVSKHQDLQIFVLKLNKYE